MFSFPLNFGSGSSLWWLQVVALVLHRIGLVEESRYDLLVCQYRRRLWGENGAASLWVVLCPTSPSGAGAIARCILRIATRGCTPLYKLRRRRPALIAVGSFHWWMVDARAATLLPFRGLAIIAVVEFLSIPAPWWLAAKRNVINVFVCVTSARTCPWKTKSRASVAGASKVRYVYTVGCPLLDRVSGMGSFFARSATAPCRRTGASTAEKTVPRCPWALYDVVAKAVVSDQCMCAIAALGRIGPTTSCAASVGRRAGPFASSAKCSQPNRLLILGIVIASLATNRRAVSIASTATTPCGGVRARAWNLAFK